jgi:putative DNA primase/helicase
MNMEKEKTVEAARGKWRGILLHFGLDPSFLEDRHGPCPICGGGKDRFRFDDKDGSGSSYCSQCECRARSGMHLLMDLKGWEFSKAAAEVDKILGVVQVEAARVERTEEQKRAALNRLWQSGHLVTPLTPAALYLERRCGDLTGLTQDLRAHAGLKHLESGGVHPALLAKMRYPDGKPASIHRTFLTPEGQKASVDPVRKVMPGFPLEGSCVRLGPLQERLGIAEGIETAICAGHLFELPVWAGISANGILAWHPPEGAKRIEIFGDNDANFVGLAAAYEKARQLRAKGYDVEVHIPPIEGQDWADVWAATPTQEAI